MSTVWGGGTQSQVTMTQSFPDILAASAQVLARDTTRQYIQIQNNNVAGINLRMNFQSAATLVCMKLQPGQTWAPNAVPVDAIHMMGELGGVATPMADNSVALVVGTPA